MLTQKMDSCIINHLSPFLESQQNYQLQCACQKSLLLISKSLEKIYNLNEGLLPPEFKLFVAKHREQMLKTAM